MVTAYRLSTATSGDDPIAHQLSPRQTWTGGEREREEIMRRIRESIAANLKFLREQKGWTQHQAAKEYGVSVGQVEKYEDERNSPEIERLGFICNKIYGVSVDSVMGLKKLIVTSEE